MTAVVDRSDVAVNRLVGRVGLAWALAECDRTAADEWLRRGTDGRRARGRVLGFDLLVARLLDALAELAATATS